LVYRCVYREQFLYFWSLSFAILGVSLSFQLATLPSLQGELIGPHIPYLLGILQFPLVWLAILSLKPPSISLRRQIIVLAWGISGLTILYLATVMVAPDPFKLAQVLRVERSVLSSGFGVLFCIAFWRRHYLARTTGGQIIILFTALRAIHYAAQAATLMGFHLYPEAYSVSAGVVAIILPFGMAAGMIMLAAEAMTTTTHQLRESEERYRTLVNASPNAVIATDPQGTILTCNRHAAELHGYTNPGEIVGMDSETLIAPSDRDRMRFTMCASRQENRPIRIECQILRHDGSVRYAELTTASRESAGAVGNVTILQDITERREAERALSREREFSTQVIDAVPGIFFVLDHEGRYVRWNKNLETITGWASEQIKAAHFLNHFHTEDQHRIADMIDAVFAEGTIEVEARVSQRKEGDIRYFYLTGRRLELEAVTYLVGCGVDITQRKEAEAARARLESQLLQSQKLDSIGRLAGGVAHDFNNHLTVIQGYCEMVLADLVHGDLLREAMESIRQAGERASTLTRQLLAFGRKQILSPKPVSLNNIVVAMEAMLRRLVPENISITTALLPQLGAAMADTGQIEQVLMNLVVNARDAMPQGGKILIETSNMEIDTVLLERQQEMRPGSYVMLAVTDTGRGMDELTQTMVFEPFFTTKEAGKGTGLGLSMVYGIVKQSGGSILVYSEPDHGSTFKVYLPRVDAEAQPISNVTPAGRIQSGSSTILLVEDQDAVRTLVSRVLQMCGYRVIEASNGLQALALAASELKSVDLLITDVVMPEMSGKDLATRLATLRESQRVLYISGYTPNAIVHLGILDPGVFFLQKPFNPAQISAKVNEILSNR
jgi:PAS domain S-box-containing protein